MLRPAASRSFTILVLVVTLVVLSALPAAAADPGLEITGEPTAEETAEIIEQWQIFVENFDGFTDCMGPIVVRVVARAEDWYGVSDVGPIAAFYSFPPNPMIYVEHRKVVPRNLLHEFAHHLDVSCSLGDSPSGTLLRTAQDIPARRGWYSGGSWSAVPAEVFAESVVAFFGAPTRIDIGTEAIEVVRALTSVPDRGTRELQRRRVDAAVSGLRSSDGTSAHPLPAPGVFAI